MYKIMLALHLLFAIFAVGPLIHATSTAARGLRTGDVATINASSKSTRIYSYASFLAVVFGFGLMSAKAPWGGDSVASFSEPWIWISLILWFAAIVLALVVIVPTLDDAADKLKGGGSASALIGKVAAAGGVIALLFLVTVFLMVYKPGA